MSTVFGNGSAHGIDWLACKFWPSSFTASACLGTDATATQGALARALAIAYPACMDVHMLTQSMDKVDYRNALSCRISCMINTKCVCGCTEGRLSMAECCKLHAC